MSEPPQLEQRRHFLHLQFSQWPAEGDDSAQYDCCRDAEEEQDAASPPGACGAAQEGKSPSITQLLQHDAKPLRTRATATAN